MNILQLNNITMTDEKNEVEDYISEKSVEVMTKEELQEFQSYLLNEKDDTKKKYYQLILDDRYESGH